MKKIYYYKNTEITQDDRLYIHLPSVQLCSINDKIDPEIEVYYWNIYSRYKHNSTCFTDNIPDIHWDNIRNNNKIFIYDSGLEAFGKDSVKNIEQVITQKYIKPEQIYFIVVDDLWKNDLKKYIKHKIKIVTANFFWVRDQEITYQDQQFDMDNKKFSLFSRHNRLERTQFFCELIKQDLLKECHYTFCAINPYTDTWESAITGSALGDDQVVWRKQREFDHPEINKEFFSHKEKIQQWLKGIPYTYTTSGSRSFDSKSDWLTLQNYQAIYLVRIIEHSDIHIVIESLVDEKNYICSHFFTEKTIKAMISKKPFLIYSMPDTCYHLQRFGFKTFHPYIDESYSSIKDSNERRRAIVQEMKRINELSPVDYQELLEKCKPIAEYNYKICKKLSKTDPVKIYERILNL